jgi:MoxR-like ATPase
MEYEKYFDMESGRGPKPFGAAEDGTRDGAQPAGDRRDGRVYVFNERIELAVNVALATTRPLLVGGPSGGGKSSLARSVAHRLGWRYYEQVISSRTQARDLLWTFDSLRRLGDAQAERLVEDSAHYVEPGVLWWAFEPETARWRGRDPRQVRAAADPGSGDEGEGAVVLLDEIDKADPDVPNNLLVPLGSFRFDVTDTNRSVEARRPLLVIITTNDERVLPPAFMRRCVALELDAPDPATLVKIAAEHYGPDEKGIYLPIANHVAAAAGQNAAAAGPDARTAGASTAEYLDTVRACLALDITPAEGDPRWQALVSATLAKRQAGA